MCQLHLQALPEVSVAKVRMETQAVFESPTEPLLFSFFPPVTNTWAPIELNVCVYWGLQSSKMSLNHQNQIQVRDAMFYHECPEEEYWS